MAATTNPATKTRSLTRFSSWVLFSALAFVSLYTRAAVKTKFGPLFLLEWVYLIAILGYVGAFSRKLLPSFKDPVTWILPFVIWGFLRLGLDLLHYGESDKDVPLERLLKYALLFVYPLLWVSLGWIQRSLDPKFTWVLLFALFTATIGNFTGVGILHVSLGPLMAIALVYLCTEVISAYRLKQDLSPYLWTTLAMVFLLTFMPFWNMWHGFMQRTNLVYLLLILGLTPWLIKKKGYSRKFAPLVTGTLLVGCIVGGIAYHYLFYSGTALYGADGIFSLPTSFQKGDDQSSDPNAPKLQFRSRKYMWANAWKHWQDKPVIGNGFNLEIPSELREGFPNKTGAVEKDEPPVTGPHCSYLQVLARTGLIGAVLFAIPFLLWFGLLFRKLFTQSTTPFTDLVLFWVCVSGALYATLHVGLESPHHAFILWFFFGIALKSVANGSQTLTRN